jgi:hypothetical protein
MGGVQVPLHLSSPQYMMEMSGQPHATPALPPGKNPNTHWIGNWVGPRAGTDGFGVQKSSCPCQDSNPRPSSP